MDLTNFEKMLAKLTVDPDGIALLTLSRSSSWQGCILTGEENFPNNFWSIPKLTLEEFIQLDATNSYVYSQRLLLWYKNQPESIGLEIITKSGNHFEAR